jgi:hypothetical protein
MSRRALTALMFASFVLGVLVMVVLEQAVGVILLFVFIVSGVFLIADPEFLEQEDP